jgi:HEPN domain-containing protein
MNAPQLEAQRWFRQARADLEVAHTLQEAKHYAAACFHSQQSAEKALKAVLYSQGARIVLGHAVTELVRQCQAHDPDFANIMDQFYISTRYPNGLPSPAVPGETYTETQARTALDAVERVLGMAEGFLRNHTDILSE